MVGRVIKNYFSTPGHSNANGQVEATNKTLIKLLKKKLEDRKGASIDFLLEVLWSYKTTTRTPTEKSPSALTFRTKALIPVKVGSLSSRVKHHYPGLNSEGMRLHRDLLHERRDKA
jgi:hypothetical protein